MELQFLYTPTDVVGITYQEGCGFGKKTISIAYNGRHLSVPYATLPECKMGNIKHGRLKDIMMSLILKEIIYY